MELEVQTTVLAWTLIIVRVSKSLNFLGVRVSLDCQHYWNCSRLRDAPLSGTVIVFPGRSSWLGTPPLILVVPVPDLAQI